MMLGVASLPHNGDVDDGKPHRHLMTSFSQSSDPVRPLNRLNPVCDDFELRLDASSSCSFSVPFGKSALRLPLHAACSAGPVSIRRPRSRVPRLGTRLGGLRLAVLRCVRPHCRAHELALFRYTVPTARKECPGGLGDDLVHRQLHNEIWNDSKLSGGGRFEMRRYHAQVSGRNHSPPRLPPQCHKDRC